MNLKLKFLLYVSILSNFSGNLFGPIYALFVLGIGGNVLIASSAWAVFKIVESSLTIFFGKLEDLKQNKEKFMFYGFLILTITNFLFIFIKTPILLYLLQVLFGIGMAMVNPAWEALYSLSLDKGKESSEWSYWNASVGFSIALAAFLGGLIVTYYGFKTLFIIMALFHLISAFIAYSLIKKSFTKKWKNKIKRKIN